MLIEFAAVNVPFPFEFSAIATAIPHPICSHPHGHLHQVRCLARERGQQCITITSKGKGQRCIGIIVHEVVQFLWRAYVNLVMTKNVRFCHLGLGLADIVLDPQLLQYLRYKKNWIHVHHDVIEIFALRLKAIRDTS
jgi:hypothetical protein